MSARVAGALVRSGALPRTIRWPPAVLCAAGAVAFLVALAHPGISSLRVVAVALAFGVGFVLDDPAGELLAASPTRLSVRSAVRVGAGVALAGVPWAVAVTAVDPGTGAWALTVELAALAAVVLAVAAWTARLFARPDPGVTAGPVLLALVGAAIALPPQYALLVQPGPQWTAAHQRWAVVLAAATLTLAGALRDPARSH